VQVERALSKPCEWFAVIRISFVERPEWAETNDATKQIADVPLSLATGAKPGARKLEARRVAAGQVCISAHFAKLPLFNLSSFFHFIFRFFTFVFYQKICHNIKRMDDNGT
jgi:hypothetical protein